MQLAATANHIASAVENVTKATKKNVELLVYQHEFPNLRLNKLLNPTRTQTLGCPEDTER